MQMKFFKSILITFLFLLVCLNVFSQTRTVTIVVQTDTIPPDSKVYITGNSMQLGEWNFMQSMEKISSNSWRYFANGITGDTLLFKFNRGDWSTEAVDKTGLEFPNNMVVIKSDTIIKFTIPNWRDIVQKKIIITPQRLANKSNYLEIIEGWKYQIGDDTSWAAPDYDDSNWKFINPALRKEDFQNINWTGNVWFRNKIYVDSSLLNKAFGLYFVGTGASEIYLNGKLIYSFGKVGYSKETEESYFDMNPRSIVFSGGNYQILAVRYSNHQTDKFFRYGFRAGFTFDLWDINSSITRTIDFFKEISIHRAGFASFILAFSIIHLLLFLFYPKARYNLYYSICMLAFAGIIYFDGINNFSNSVNEIILNQFFNNISIQISILFGLLTVYEINYNKIAKQFYLFLFVAALIVIQSIFFPEFEKAFMYVFYLLVIAVAIEIIRLSFKVKSNNNDKKLGWLVSIGFLLAMAFIIYQILIIANVISQPIFGIRVVYVYGILMLAVTVSISLSKRFADTNRDLEKQLKQIKELSEAAIEQERKAKEEEIAKKLLAADNVRKTKELDEARKFQLAMLPKNIPLLNNVDISVYMKPANEVGGDYYDFKYISNDSLIVAIGDAAGHGMKAGTMVAAIKGLFTAENHNMDLVNFLNKSNSVIKNMQLGSLFMAMIVAKLEKNVLTFSSAGMPPILLYKHSAKTVETLKMQAIPLGASHGFNYNSKEVILDSGDTVLFMSDGFPELFNENKEILNYDKTAQLFQQYATQNTDEIIASLINEADKWRGKRPQEDDITFIVMKIK